MEAVRRAITYVEEKLGDPHPLVNPNMRTDGISLFLQRYGRLEQVSHDGQLAIQEVLEMSLERLDWGPAGVLRLYPFTRGGAASRELPRVVVIDPTVAFGRPVLMGTRVPTAAISSAGRRVIPSRTSRATLRSPPCRFKRPFAASS